MAKGAANEAKLGGMHSILATLLTKTMEKDLKELELLEAFRDTFKDGADPDDPELVLLAETLAHIKGPNPALLSVVAKFLKDNDIGMDSEEIDALSATQRRLQERAKNRPKLSLVDLPAMEA